MSATDAADRAAARVRVCAMALAAAVDIQDRIATDPTYPAARSAFASESRAKLIADWLREYRSAVDVERALREDRAGCEAS